MVISNTDLFKMQNPYDNAIAEFIEQWQQTLEQSKMNWIRTELHIFARNNNLTT